MSNIGNSNLKKSFEDILNEQRKLIYSFRGISMMPLLRSGRDLVVIEKVMDSNYQPMDVVLFKRINSKGDIQYVLHRILREDEQGVYWIVGDNCISGDYVRQEQILGKMTSMIRDRKEVSLTDPGYRRYVSMWCKPYRIRISLMKVLMYSTYCIKRILERKE